jgi:peptide deformylase
MNLTVAQLGQPVLRRRAVEVSDEELAAPEFQQLIDDMLETLEAAQGAGLAAPQVSVSKRLFLAGALPPAEEDGPPGVEVFVNPRVLPVGEGRAAAWEGCLSFPELLVLVSRFTAVRVDYLDRRGEPRSLELTGFAARVIQHENDHLDGVLTLDRAPSTRCIVKASEIETVLKEMEQSAPPA